MVDIVIVKENVGLIIMYFNTDYARGGGGKRVCGDAGA